MRSAVAAAGLAADLAGRGAPAWATADLPDDVLAMLNRVIAAPTWQEAATILRSPEAHVLFTPEGQRVRTVVERLYTDQGAVMKALRALDDCDRGGLDQVLDELCTAEKHRHRLAAWMGTPTWTASRRYLVENLDLLDNPRTEPLLAELQRDPRAQRHLGIVRLAARGLPIDEIYDLVVDPVDAADAAFAAIGEGDLDKLTDICHTAPHLARTPFVGPYLAAVLAIYYGQSDDDRRRAQQLIKQATEHRELIGGRDDLAHLRSFTVDAPAKLRRLADRQPDLAEALR